MPTSEERREIAKRLRDLKQLGRYSTACLVCEALSIDDMCPKDCDPERRLLDVAHAISDIIDPEPERACSIESRSDKTIYCDRKAMADELRALAEFPEEVDSHDLARTLGLEATSRYGYAPEDVLRLADIIDHKPERTCHPVFGECDLCKWPLRDGALYCDHCGARIEVVGNAD